MADIKQIQVGGTNYNISGAAIVLEDNGTSEEAPNLWKTKTSQISSIVDGQLFLYKITKTCENYSLTKTDFTVEIKNGNTLLGTFPLTNLNFYLNKTRLTSYFHQNQYVLMVATTHSNAQVLDVVNTQFNKICNVSKILGYYDNGTPGIIYFDGNVIRIHASNFEIDHQGSFKNNNMRISSSKIESNYHLILTNNTQRIEMDSSNNTKIYLGYDNNHTDCTQMRLTSNGLKLNRPIYLADDGDSEEATGLVLHTNAQALTTAQKSQVRTNIGAGTSNLTIGTTSTTAAAGNHTHGNITNTGTITSTAVTSATGVLVYDSSNKIQRATAANARSIIGAAPTSHASTATTYGVGTSSSYGHVKVISGDLNGKSATDGYAASQSHSHSNYQTTLVSGTNIKTINNQSLLGSGDISISGSSNYTHHSIRWYGTSSGIEFQLRINLWSSSRKTAYTNDFDGKYDLITDLLYYTTTNQVIVQGWAKYGSVERGIVHWQVYTWEDDDENEYKVFAPFCFNNNNVYTSFEIDEMFNFGSTYLYDTIID